MRKYTFIIQCILVLLHLSPIQAIGQSLLSYEQDVHWKQSKFIIGTFYDPILGGTATKDIATLQTAREAFFNLLSGYEWRNGHADSFQDNIYRLELADLVNFKSLIMDNRLTGRWHFDPTVATNLTNDYKNLSVPLRRAMLGYQIGDEPKPPLYTRFNEQKTAIKDWVSHFRDEDPSKLAYVNFLPFFPWDALYPDKEDINGNGQCDQVITLSYQDWPTEGQEIDLDGDGCVDVGDHLRAAYYERYLTDLANDPNRKMVLDLVSYDHYPFVSLPSGETWTRDTYFENLSMIRQKAGTRPFWAYPMSMGHGSYVDPEDTHLRFMAFSPITYGAKGLIYYTYSDLPAEYGYRSALIDDKGVPTPRYYDVQRINHYIHNIVGPVVMNSVHLGAFHKSNDPTLEVIPQDQKINSNTPLISDINNENILFGLFRDAENYYVLIVNKSLSEINRVVPTLKGDYRAKIELAPSVTSYKDGDIYEGITTYYFVSNNKTQFIVDSLAGGEGRLVKVEAPNLFIDLIGDVDNFSPGEDEDIPRWSAKVIGTLGSISAETGFLQGVDLDVGGANRPVGFTHVLPTNAFITSANVRFRLRAEDSLVYNDTILYDDSVSSGTGQPYVPFIALRDLLGREPANGEILRLEMDLSRVPVRTQDTSGGPAGHLSASPDEFRNLLPLLNDGEFDMVFTDDVAVDYSEMVITYENAKSYVTFAYDKITFKPSTDTTGCPVDFEGKFYFDATLTNTSNKVLSSLRVGIHELTNDNLLLVDGERIEAGEWFEIPTKDGYENSELLKCKRVTVPFTVCPAILILNLNFS